MVNDVELNFAIIVLLLKKQNLLAKKLSKTYNTFTIFIIPLFEYDSI